MKILYLIPARGGSKGLLGKNIKPLDEIPLVNYSIEAARTVASDKDICVSTDSEEIKKIAESANLKVPFLRPDALADDKAGMSGVIVHALDFYNENKNIKYDAVMLLQPTSPFRKTFHLSDVREIYQENPDVEMIVSVGISHHNPYFSLVEENSAGYLELVKKADFQIRQDCPAVYFYNGSIYLINARAIKNKSSGEFTKVKKYVMDDKYCVDIDTIADWEFAEYLVKNNKL
ncbi:acylneuraminate cytidylyltransferase family protein [soil metagenome]